MRLESIQDILCSVWEGKLPDNIGIRRRLMENARKLKQPYDGSNFETKGKR